MSKREIETLRSRLRRRLEAQARLEEEIAALREQIATLVQANTKPTKKEVLQRFMIDHHSQFLPAHEIVTRLNQSARGDVGDFTLTTVASYLSRWVSEGLVEKNSIKRYRWTGQR